MLKQDSYLLLYIKEAIGFAQVRRICRLRAAGAKGIFSFAKENIPFGTPRERLRLAVSGLNNSDVSEVKVPRARRSRVSIARRFASAPTTRCCAAVGGSDALRMRHTPCGCRSASLAVVRPNHRLSKHSTMRRASAMLLFRTQSAAEKTSLAPHDSKARLLSGRDSQGFMAKPCTPHPHCAARAALQAANPQWRGQGAEPLAFSWGSKGAILSRERMAPLFRAAPAALLSLADCKESIPSCIIPRLW